MGGMVERGRILEDEYGETEDEACDKSITYDVMVQWRMIALNLIAQPSVHTHASAHTDGAMYCGIGTVANEPNKLSIPICSPSLHTSFDRNKSSKTQWVIVGLVLRSNR